MSLFGDANLRMEIAVCHWCVELSLSIPKIQVKTLLLVNILKNYKKYQMGSYFMIFMIFCLFAPPTQNGIFIEVLHENLPFLLSFMKEEEISYRKIKKRSEQGQISL